MTQNPKKNPPAAGSFHAWVHLQNIFQRPRLKSKKSADQISGNVLCQEGKRRKLNFPYACVLWIAAKLAGRPPTQHQSDCWVGGAPILLQPRVPRCCYKIVDSITIGLCRLVMAWLHSAFPKQWSMVCDGPITTQLFPERFRLLTTQTVAYPRIVLFPFLVRRFGTVRSFSYVRTRAQDFMSR